MKLSFLAAAFIAAAPIAAQAAPTYVFTFANTYCQARTAGVSGNRAWRHGEKEMKRIFGAEVKASRLSRNELAKLAVHRAHDICPQHFNGRFTTTAAPALNR